MFSEEIVEKGLVKSAINGISKLEVLENGDCEDCSAKVFCSTKSGNSKVVSANNPVDAKPGQIV